MSKTLQTRLVAGCDGPVQFCSGRCSAQGHGNGDTFFHSRWLIQINSTEMVTESTVLGGHQQFIRTVLMSPSGVLMGSVSTF